MLKPLFNSIVSEAASSHDPACCFKAITYGTMVSDTSKIKTAFFMERKVKYEFNHVHIQ